MRAKVNRNGRKDVSTSMAVAAIIVALIVGLGIGFAAAPVVSPPPPPTTITQTVTTTAAAAEKTVTVTTTVSAAEKTVTSVVTSTVEKTVTAGAPGLTGEIPIGALLPLSGVLATFGENNKVMAEIAVEEVNEFLEKSGAGWRLKLLVEDTETKPDVALEKLMSLYARGVKAVVGPMASAGVKNLKEYADSNKILVISPSSTAPALAIPDDYIFRFCPTDLIQGPIGPKFAKKVGATHIIFVWRGDAWGDGLIEEAKKSAQDLGLTIAAEIRYAPEATEFSAEAATLADKVNELVGAGVAPENIVVELVAFEEAKMFFIAAADYDVLWQVRWFGSDGTAKSAALLEEPKAAEFSAKTRFLNPIFTPTKTPKFRELTEKIQAELGRTPEAYAYDTYDAIWAIALAIMSTGTYDGEALKNVLPDIVAHYYGASGYIPLNEAGDRAYADYELWEIVEKDGEYEWVATGLYSFATDSLTWS